MSQSTQPNGALNGAPAQPSTKGSATAPKLNSEDMELGHLPANGEPSTEPDIMQLARVGDVPAMQKLFETTELDATYVDNEGITPLHVSLKSTLTSTPNLPTVENCLSDMQNSSGLLLTTSFPCVNS